MLQAFQQSTLAAAGKVDLSITSTTGDPFPEDTVDKVRKIEGINAAAPSLQQNVTLPPSKKREISVISIVGIEPANSRKVSTFPISKGVFIKSTDKNKVVMNVNAADKLNVKPGDVLKVPSSTGTTDLQVVGLLKNPSLPGVEQVFVPLDTAQSIFDAEGKINTIEAAYKVGADRTAIKKEVNQKLGENYKIGTLGSGTELVASLKTGQFAYNLFGIMALLMGAFIILNTFRTAVAERRHDIGMLRAIGASRKTILGTFLVEGLFQGIIGTALGIVFGYLFVTGFFRVIGPIYKEVLHFSFDIKFVFDTVLFIEAVVLGIGVAVAGALLPAISASKITPVEALRPAIGDVYEKITGKRAWIGLVIILLAAGMLITGNISLAGLSITLFFIGMILVAPVLIKPIADLMSKLSNVLMPSESTLAKGNVTRQPNRAAITASAIMISLAVVISLSGLISSIFAGFTSYLDKSMGSDFLIIPRSIVLSSGNVGAGPKLAKDIRNINGMGTVTSLRLAKTKADASAVQAIGIDPKTYPDVATLEFSEGSSEASFDKLSEGRFLIANGIYAGQKGIKKGDKLKLLTLNGKKTYTVAGIGSDYLNAKLSTIYISQKNMEKDFNIKSDIMFLANAKPGANDSQVKTKLEKVVNNYPAFTLYDKAGFRRVQLDIFDQSLALFNILLALLALPTLLALINTLTINVVSRIHELGMLRAVGGTRGQIKLMITAESLMLASIGSAFGILAGVWLGYVLVGAMNSTAFITPYYFPWAGILIAIAAALFFGVLASLIPARQAARLDIVKALHYE